MPYNLNLQKAVERIRETNAKTVCIQLPSGLKPEAVKIASTLEKETSAKIIIWAGSCFGACDIPDVDADLLIQWGHSRLLTS